VVGWVARNQRFKQVLKSHSSRVAKTQRLS